jgi:aminoglycoside phosphotransferase (APT) family kinase protein
MAPDERTSPRRRGSSRRTRPHSERRPICRRDIHPFNLLVDGDRWTLLDSITALIADPAFDLAYAVMMLRRAPMAAPPPLRAVLYSSEVQQRPRVLADCC